MYQVILHDRHPEYGKATANYGQKDGFELNFMYLYESQAWCHRLLMPALRRLRQEHQKFKDSLAYLKSARSV